MRRGVYSTSEKLPQSKTASKQSKNIHFNIDKSSLSCFISKTAKKPISKTQRSKQHSFKKQIKEEIKEIKSSTEKEGRIPIMRRKTSSLIENDSGSFSNKLLFLSYGTQQVYVDSCKKESSKESRESKKSNGNFEEDEFISYNLRVITQQTTNSSNPAHFTPNSLSPSSSTRYLFSPQQNDIYCFNRCTKEQARNKKAINNQQGKAFIIQVDSVESDGRTTLMVRNIPNRYTQQMLLDLFYKNHKKKIDFFYLPIDFKNKCNVGYAFVNFIHAKFIKEFYEQFHGQKWNKFNSEKICQICYARIQGTAQLSNHFEYSSVLQQRDRRFRPLIGINQSVFSNLSTIVEKQKKQRSQQQ